MSKVCQSCGMPLKKETDFGTEQDNTKSNKFCVHCFKDGQFIEPNITLEEMQTKSMGIMTQMYVPKFMAKMFVKKIAKLERWQK